MTRAFSFLASLFAAVLASAAASAEPKALVELFTSQGCSSCVLADAYFAELAKRDDVVAISLHVDYWDYLGWRDTLGDPAYTQRQRDYAAAHGTRRVYTPQIVVNGVGGYVGSNRGAIEAAIKESALPVPVTMRYGNGTVEIDVAARPDASAKPATIRLALITSEAKVPIARGENAGRTIEYYNVVREIRPIGMWGGEAVSITLPEDEIMADGVDACAILVQEDLPSGPGAVIGAALLRHW
ncbi:MAG: DUF1223 domain-containing protein [Propylenella sp.]